MMQSNILFPRQGRDFLYFILLFVALITLVVASLTMYVGIFIRLNKRIVWQTVLPAGLTHRRISTNQRTTKSLKYP